MNLNLLLDCAYVLQQLLSNGDDVVEAVLCDACKSTKLICYHSKTTTGSTGAYVPQTCESGARMQ